MAWVTRIIGGLRGLLQRRAMEQELDAELRDFFEHVVDENVRAGMTSEAATRAARLKLGSAESVKDSVRDVGWESTVESVWQDVRYALRSLRKSPGFTAATTLTLALGIGATTAIFSLLDAVILKSLPVRNPEELVLVGGPAVPGLSGLSAAHRHLHGPVCHEWRHAARSSKSRRASASGRTCRWCPVRTSRPWAFRPRWGACSTCRTTVGLGEPPVAVASYGYWQRRFGGDAADRDRVVRISGTPVTIVGVAPPGFFGEQVGVAPDLWVPLTMWGQLVPGRNLLQSPGTGWLRLIGRVRPGVATSGVHAEAHRERFAKS